MKDKNKTVNFGKNTVLFIIAILAFSCVFFFNPAISPAQDETTEIYADKNNFFIFTPPAGWTKKEMANDTSSQVAFRSSDGKAELAVIAQFNEGESNELFSQKKSYIKDFQQRFPNGTFTLTWDRLGERKAIKINFEIPKVIKQEQYFLFEQGMRFDLIYGVGNSADFKKYRQAALDAFVTVQRQEPVKGK
ncbi:MAG: hypothetical protein PHS66_02105 [Candidatus Omnitrophica bacterium]|nr:hypothetical protein [Candidatus Omnitrophota bacterium]